MLCYLVEDDKQLVHARLALHLDQEKAQSPLKAPFGGIAFSEDLELQQLHFFIQSIIEELRMQGITSLQIKHYPQGYHPTHFVKITNAFLNEGFQIVDSEISTGITIGEEAFEGKVHTWELRKLRKCRNAGFQPIEEPIECFDTVYNIIDQGRKERGQELSMSLEELKQTVYSLRSKFHLFSVMNNNQRIACAICIRVSEKILYNFYSAHIKAYDNYSPAVLLFENLYNFCQKEGIEYLDLGTSAIEGKPNYSLIRFKEQIGGTSSLKLTFAKDIGHY